MGLFTRRGSFSEAVSNESFFTSHLAYFTQPGARVVAKSMNLKDGCTAVFLPTPNFDNPRWEEANDFLPDRGTGEETFDYRPWLFPGLGVLYFGKNPISFLFDDPDDDPGYIRNDHNPACMIVDTIWKCKNHCISTPFGTSVSDNWNDLIAKTDGVGKDRKFPAATMHQKLLMGYAMIYDIGGTHYLQSKGMPLGAASGDPLPILVMTNNCVESSLLPAFGSTVPSVEGDVLKHPVITAQKYVHFYDRQNPNCAAKVTAEVEEAQKRGGHRQQVGNAAASQLAGYGVFVSDTYSGRSADPKLNRDQILRDVGRKVIPWEKSLKGYKLPENAILVASKCGFPMSLLYHAWKSMSEYYPDNLRTALKNPVSENFGGVGQSVPVPPQSPRVIVTPASSIPAGNVLPPSPPLTTYTVSAADNPYGIPDSVPTMANDEAPWGGRISDPPTMDEIRSQGTVQSVPVNAAASAVDPAAHADAKAKLQEHMRKQAAGAGGAQSAARSQAAQVPSTK